MAYQENGRGLEQEGARFVISEWLLPTSEGTKGRRTGRVGGVSSAGASDLADVRAAVLAPVVHLRRINVAALIRGVFTRTYQYHLFSVSSRKSQDMVPHPLRVFERHTRVCTRNSVSCDIKSRPQRRDHQVSVSCV